MWEYHSNKFFKYLYHHIFEDYEWKDNFQEYMFCSILFNVSSFYLTMHKKDLSVLQGQCSLEIGYIGRKNKYSEGNKTDPKEWKKDKHMHML